MQRGVNTEWTGTFDSLPVHIDGAIALWRAVETNAPAGYISATTTVAGDNGMVAKNFVDDGRQERKGGVSISKKAAGGDEELPGATLAILDANGNELERWVSDNRPYNFTLPANATYTLREIAAPEGYGKADDIVFTITPDGDAAIDGVVVNLVTMFDPKDDNPSPTPTPNPTPNTKPNTTPSPTPRTNPNPTPSPAATAGTTAKTGDATGDIVAVLGVAVAVGALGIGLASRRRNTPTRRPR